MHMCDGKMMGENQKVGNQQIEMMMMTTTDPKPIGIRILLLYSRLDSSLLGINGINGINESRVVVQSRQFYPSHNNIVSLFGHLARTVNSSIGHEPLSGAKHTHCFSTCNACVLVCAPLGRFSVDSG